jgi:hypothetical protein
MKRLLWILPFTILLAGCPKLVQNAYSVIVGAKAFTDQIAMQHPECATGVVSTVCVDLRKAVSAKDALIDAVEIYCAGPNFNSGGACDEPAKGTPAAAQATAKLQAAIASWNQAQLDLKGVAR